MVRFGTRTAIPVGTVDLGAAPPSAALRVEVALKPRDPSGLRSFAAAVSSPGSKQYHRFLPKGGFARRFGPTMATVARVRAALRATGLNPGSASSDRLLIPITTTVRAAEKAFHVRLRRFRTATHAIVVANLGTPSVPRSIRTLVQAVLGLNNLTQPQPAGTEASHVGAQRCGGQAHADPHSWTPQNLAQAYDVEPLYDEGDGGGGESVALVEMAAYRQHDLDAYTSCFGVRAPTEIQAVDHGNTNSRGTGGLEATSDIEVLAGVAPALTFIDVYEAPVGVTGLLDEYSQIEQNDADEVVSSSWVLCELAALPYGLIATENTIFSAMASQGQTMFAAAGDQGTEGCRDSASRSQTAVDDPASQPYVTGVGGTVITALGNPPGWAPSEAAWPQSGGGISRLTPMPSWQAGPGVVNAHSSGAPCRAQAPHHCREVPDVSASATNYPVRFGGRWLNADGTSFATSVWAGALALVDAASTPTCRPPRRLGFIDPALYHLAGDGPADFNDVTRGANNAHGGKNGSYTATPGYDMATGLGTPAVTGLAESFALCGTLLASKASPVGALQSTTTPSLAASRGSLYAAFINGAPSPIYYQSYGGPGTSWGSSASTVTPGGQPAETVTSPAIAVLNGTPIVAWTDPVTGAVEESSLVDGAWSPAVRLGGGAAQSTLAPALAAGGGSLYAAWRGHATNNVYLDVNPDGAGWQPQLQIPGATTDVPPAVVYDPDLGVVIVAWMDSSGGDRLRDAMWTSSAGFFEGGPIKGAASGNGPALAVADNQLIEAHRGVSDDRIYLSAQPPGQLTGPWSALQPLGAADTNFSPALAASGDTLFSAWTAPCAVYGCSAGVFYSQLSQVPR